MDLRYGIMYKGVMYKAKIKYIFSVLTDDYGLT